MRILLVEDDESITEVLTTILTQQNYVVDSAHDGEEGWSYLEQGSYDLVLLDIMLPKLDGISFCRRLRERKNSVLVMLLTGRDTTTDKLLGLNAGADDYVVKPFDAQELAARIRALLRRGSTAATPVLMCQCLQLNPSTREVTYAGQPLRFSRKEYLLLELLLRNQHRVFNRSTIIDQLWSYSEDPPNEDTVKSHIKSIRRKLAAVGVGDMIETLYGQGYRINPIYLTDTQAATDTQTLTDTQPNPVPAMTPQQQIDFAVAEIWQRMKGMSFERLKALEQVVQSLKATQSDCMLEQLRRDGLHNAHKLAGSLGTFGFERGSQLARQVEDWFTSASDLRTIATQVEQSVNKLWQELGSAISEEAASPPNTPSTHQTTSSHGTATQPNTKILAVDDDPQILVTLKALLEPQGVEMTCLEDSSQFWTMLQTVQPDLVILDMNMPQLNGIEVCQSVRHHAEWHWLPILFLTSQTDRQTQQEIFAAGADDYVAKPIVPPELSLRVFNRINRSRSLRKHLN